ncbi:hypothetical protein C8A00DRAFT_30964 [Chaetomidium leptoderma]|uniref:Uncharacterized protein n=1 Tax=Chaetomidium leptoderma TaxID=669021 RepID=A0AAN6VQW9_9PEZI|nr:hypothetical protein C8A00DRAFT_30964 [Chaetomidium leptoderma]
MSSNNDHANSSDTRSESGSSASGDAPPALVTWEAVSSSPEGRMLQQVYPRQPDHRRQPWQEFHSLKEESTYIVGDDMRLLGGRINAHSS